jgi:hypothetical protein
MVILNSCWEQYQYDKTFELDSWEDKSATWCTVLLKCVCIWKLCELCHCYGDSSFSKENWKLYHAFRPVAHPNEEALVIVHVKCGMLQMHLQLTRITLCSPTCNSAEPENNPYRRRLVWLWRLFENWGTEHSEVFSSDQLCRCGAGAQRFRDCLFDTETLKRWAPTPHLHDWSYKNTSRHTVSLKAWNHIYIKGKEVKLSLCLIN